MASFTVPTKAVKWVVVLTAIIVFGLAAFSSAVFTVQYGTVGVLTRFGKITGDPAEPGLHFKIPFVDKVVTYRTQKIIYETLDPNLGLYTNNSNADYQDYAVDTTTKDGQQVSIRYTVRFSINPDEIKNIANNIGTEEEVIEKIVKTDSRIWARNVPRNYSALELYTGNIEQVSLEIRDILEPIFEENGLILDEFGIRSINFDDSYVAAIEQKQIEKERISTEEYIAQQEEYKKLALITKAEGEAEAQRLQQATLNDQVLQKLYLEKWDGVLPNTMCSDSNGIMLNVGN